MNAETETFIQTLFSRCMATSVVSYITLSAIHPDGDRPTPSRHVPLGKVPPMQRAVHRLIDANERGWGAYVGVAARRRSLGRWARGGKRDLAVLPAVFVDMDNPDDALLRLGWFDLPASMILHSGHGFHAYWLLETPTTDFATADRVIHGLAQHLGGDEVLSVAQSMRLAGTINTKPGRENTLCSFVSYHPNRLYDLTEFRQFMPVDVIDRHPLHGHAVPTSIEHQYRIDNLTDAVVQLLDGRYRSNGYIAARCPFAHFKDRPGAHFSYSPDTGWGYCFGKHGKISPDALATILAVQLADADTETAA